MTTKREQELELRVASLTERLRMTNEMLRSAPAQLLRSLAERDAKIAALQVQKPVRLKRACAQLGLNYHTAWDWVTSGKVKQLSRYGSSVVVDANELARVARALGAL